MTTTPLRKVAFLDTNVLHFMDLYLRHAKEGGLFPFGGDPAAAEKHLNATIKYKSLKSSLNKGLNVIEHLRRENCRAEYSSASELELMAGRARGKAIEKAAAEGIPDRMWTRLSESEISDRLIATDLIAIGETVEGFRALLHDADIDTTVGRSDRSRDVLELAKDVMGIVYMSAMDSIIYAGALVAEADHVISYDRYLKETVNRLKTKESLREARWKLESRTAAVLSREPKSITLPNAVDVRGGKH